MIIDNKKRIGWVDVLRGFSIFLVLLGHNNPPFIKFIYGFHMPLFFVISGYLYHDYKVTTHIYNIVKRYYIEYVLLCIFNGIIYEFLAMIVNRTNQMNWMEIKNNIGGILLVNSKNMDGCYPLWFLPTLAISEIIFIFIMQIKNNYIRIGLITSIAVAGLCLGNVHVFVPFRVSAALVGVLFLGVGHFMSYKKIFIHNETQVYELIKVVAFAILLVVGFIAIYKNLPDSRVDMSNGVYGNAILFFIGAISTCYCVMFIFSYIAYEGENILIFRIFRFIGLHTVFIVAFDEMTNNVGGLFVDKYIKRHIWYTDFLVRIIVLGICFSIYYGFITSIKVIFKRLEDKGVIEKVMRQR